MSFENMKDREDQVLHERVCAILYHFTANEVRQLQNIARISGINETVIVGPENGDQIVRNILDGEVSGGCMDAPREKAVIFNSVPMNRVNGFIDMLKKFRVKRPLIAIVTEQSIEWELKAVIENLVEERSTLAQNKMSKHTEESK